MCSTQYMKHWKACFILISSTEKHNDQTSAHSGHFLDKIPGAIRYDHIDLYITKKASNEKWMKENNIVKL